ncbi:MAG: HEPN domain-containing protein [Thermoplasmata archaeon]|nr:HEPN domain-containing protein [Thermoplasmata archaeon]
MMAEIRTRAVDRHKFKNYLKKADEHYKAMELSYETGLWTACVVNAIHCAINSIDALTVFYLGFRHAGDRHHDVLQLLLKLDIDKKELRSKSQQLSNLLSIKNAAEYEERLMDAKDAENARKASDRLYTWVREKLK